jgi:GntR family transcriptional regulator, transcriptional repressor for pyruvate dehydrogenase complex
MTKFKPVKQSRVSNEVVDQLKESILAGHLKSGDRLSSERELASQFQVSRVTMREALRALENLGFIATRQGVAGGPYVTDLNFEHLVDSFLDLFMAEKITIPDLHQVRLFIEPEVARLAALNVKPAYAKRLKEALAAEKLPIRELVEDVDRKMLVHFILAEMCGNNLFEAIVRALMGLTRRVVEAVGPDPRTMHPAGMHAPIVEAVLARDPRAASEAMLKHAIDFGKTLVKMEMAFRNKRRAPRAL